VQAIVQTKETFDHPNLSQYGISDATKIYYNPSYELCSSMKPIRHWKVMSALC